MHKHVFRSTLYHLIEAGQLARLVLLRPLQELGLHAGDDAILLALRKKKGMSDEQLCSLTGLTPATLQPRIDRLLALSLVRRITIGNDLLPGTRLTKKGRKVRKTLLAHWQELEDALMHQLSHAQKNELRDNMKRFADLLSL